jgi:hypothetical protein
MNRQLVSVLLASTLACSVQAQTASTPTISIRGTYSHPKPFWAKGARLDEYHINAIFVHGGSINEDLMLRAESEGAKVYAEFATLNGKNYVDKHPAAWPINEKGEPAPAATWFMGACPTEPGFKAHRLQQLAQLLDRHDIAGVWMDYFHWHAQFEDPNPIFPETCFSKTCLDTFQSATGIGIPEGTTAAKARWILTNHDRKWRDWRCSVLVDWARDIRKILRQKRPQALLGVYHCPWTDVEFGGARRRILGLDFERLATEVDVFSPMVYHARMGRTPEWVGEYISWFSKRLSIQPDRFPKLWPIVQAHNEPGVISAQEFEKVLSLGASGEATGVMMFTIRSVAESDEKMKVLKKLYREWAGE